MSHDQRSGTAPEGRDPTPEEIRWHLQQAARLRSEALHGILYRAAPWVGGGAVGEPEPFRRYGNTRHPRTA